MIKRYFLTALRALKRNWSYSVINGLGLTLGLTCCLLLFVAVRYELSFDQHHANAGKIYRMLQASKTDNDQKPNTGIPHPAIAALRNDFPEIKDQVTMTSRVKTAVVTVGGKEGKQKFQETDGIIALAEPQFFRLFSYDWISGNKQTALNRPGTVVLSERIARKYFGNADPMGKTIRVDNKMDFLVTGIVHEQPATSSIPFEILLSFSSMKEFGYTTNPDDWQSTYGGAHVYMQLPDNLSQARMEQRLLGFVQKYHNAEGVQKLKYILQPLTAIHFDPKTTNYARRSISMEMIWAMVLIGGFILVTACINFINLATAQAIRRAKEVGVRKVLGSTRGQLIRQFLGETGILTGMSIGLALLAGWLALPYVGELLNMQPEAVTVFNPVVAGFLVLIGLLTTVLAGFYPALVLSGYQPILALKGRIKATRTGQYFTLRRGLIIAQFAISQMLIIGTIIAYNQMQFFRSADLGFSHEAVITIPIPRHDPGMLENLSAKIKGLPGIKSYTFAMTTPSSSANWTTGFRFENDNKEPDYGVLMRPADTAYVHTYGLKLLAGRMFLPADSMREFVINEAFMKKLGFRRPEQVIGKYLRVNGEDIKKPIVGVVKDFNTFSLHEQTPPTVLASFRDQYGSLGIKLSTREGGADALHSLLSEVETAWSAVYPEFVFRYEFLDDSLAKFYKNEQQFYALFRLLAGIALFIGCLGLYGVVAFMAESRTKEVGIRKVLGATSAHIVGLFSIDFVKLVLIALVIASPVAWYVMDRWLQDFAYKIAIQWWMFAIAGLLTVLIALLTVSFQSIKAAMINPVKSLKSE
ncbi:ABC transporter permease [Arsenicibacter rosenii]|uniref:ABC transporter permease n=1 Tax=Arsenicibacter rosenii TaxID=1750698 RepID=A0A1S2VEG7_9BACT|nr:ABC transporter permease [Arsenicibacter rosenii]OIN56298.1 hypothetical protein BLX24_25655 [Arsenicibacter rosenii]